MKRDQKHTAVERIAQILSDVFSPIVLPAYMMAVAMWMTPLIAMPEKARFVAMGIVVFLTAIVPTATILTLIKLGRVSDVSLSSRSERTLPYLVTIISYLATVIFLKYISTPHWLPAFYLGAAGASVVASIITMRWKISAHGSAVGGFAAGIIWLAMHGLLLVGARWWVCGAILLCGLIGTARLILKRHTPAQVYAGVALGALAVTVALILTNN